MSYTSFDPRISIREKIGTLWDVESDNNLEYCLKVLDEDGEDLYIPMYLSEEVQSENLPTMPFLEMEITRNEYEPHDINASTRKMTSYIDIHLFLPDMDNIDRTTMGKTIKDDLHNLVRTNQCDFTGITFINVESDDYQRETDGRQVIYHYIITVYCLYWDLCT